MAETILFRGAVIRHFDGRREKNNAYVRIHMTADISTPVMDEMDWEDPGSSISRGKLKGGLCASNLILTPGDKNLRKREIQFGIQSVDDFVVVEVKEKDSSRRELRFVVETSERGVAGLIDEYNRDVGDHKSALKISYVKQDELPLRESKPEPSTGDDDRQQKIDDALKSDVETGCTACNAGLPVVDGKHESGDLCTATTVAGEPPLASAAVMGGSHQKRAKRTGPTVQ